MHDPTTALKHNDRVCQIVLKPTPGWQWQNASIAVVFFLALHCIIASYLWSRSMHVNISNPNILLHEGHSLAYTTSIGGNGQFTTAIQDECVISWGFRKNVSQSVSQSGLGNGNVLLTFWSSGRSRPRKRRASYSSARVGDVRHGSRATYKVRRKKEKRKRGGWTLEFWGVLEAKGALFHCKTYLRRILERHDVLRICSRTTTTL